LLQVKRVPIDCLRSQTSRIIIRGDWLEIRCKERFHRSPARFFNTLEETSVRFSIGDLVAEKKVNHWYFSGSGHGYGYTMYPYYTPDEYWDEYYERAQSKTPSIGIVIDVKENDPAGYYQMETFMTYRVMWLNLEEHDYMMNRWFYGDELRLLSKINRSKSEEGEDGDE